MKTEDHSRIALRIICIAIGLLLLALVLLLGNLVSGCAPKERHIARAMVITMGTDYYGHGYWVTVESRDPIVNTFSPRYPVTKQQFTTLRPGSVVTVAFVRRRGRGHFAWNFDGVY
jgi:hypothetical protein